MPHSGLNHFVVNDIVEISPKTQVFLFNFEGNSDIIRKQLIKKS